MSSIETDSPYSVDDTIYTERQELQLTTETDGGTSVLTVSHHGEDDPEGHHVLVTEKTSGSGRPNYWSRILHPGDADTSPGGYEICHLADEIESI